MKRVSIAIGCAAVATLVFALAAEAKGPSAASISGPGLAKALRLTGNGESGDGALGELTLDGGFFQQSFGQTPDRRLPKKPAVALGPRYRVVYTVPGLGSGPGESGPGSIRQDIYPYAPGGVITFMAPGQPFFGNQRTVGGWYRVTGWLHDTLVTAGLPSSPPPPPSPARSSAQSGFGTTSVVAAVLVVTALALAAVIVLRRRASKRGGGAARTMRA